MIVGPQHEDEVLERDDDDQCPEDQRQDAEDVVVRRGDRVRAMKALADRVERARADVAVDDAERGEREHDESPAVRRGRPTCASVATDCPSTCAAPAILGRPTRRF